MEQLNLLIFFNNISLSNNRVIFDQLNFGVIDKCFLIIFKIVFGLGGLFRKLVVLINLV